MSLTFLNCKHRLLKHGRKAKRNVNTTETVISLRRDGFSQYKIADIIGVSQSCISKFLRKFNRSGNIENLPRSGRPRKTDERGGGGRKILRCVKTDRRQTLAEITNEANNALPSSVSSRTFRRRLRFFWLYKEENSQNINNSERE